MIALYRPTGADLTVIGRHATVTELTSAIISQPSRQCASVRQDLAL